jgi:hypothetical protein
MIINIYKIIEMYNFLFYIIFGFYSIKFIYFLYRYISIDNIIKHTYIYNLSFEDGSVDRNIMNFNSFFQECMV